MKYGQYCPVAKAAETLGARWSLLIIRELMFGPTRFTDLQRALNRASPRILATRLRELEDAGVIKKNRGRDSGRHEYCLTKAGLSLEGLINELGEWGTQWAPSNLPKEDLDEYLLILDISRTIDSEIFPNELTTIAISFDLNSAAFSPDWWIVIRNDEYDVCDVDPKYDVDCYLSATLRSLTAIWLGNLGIDEALRQGKMNIQGDRFLKEKFRQWFTLSAYAKKTEQL